MKWGMGCRRDDRVILVLRGECMFISSRWCVLFYTLLVCGHQHTQSCGTRMLCVTAKFVSNNSAV
jgi:hypothetical protein